jgi:TusA-related sulfurtransferase
MALPPETPPIVCEYGILDMPHLLNEVQKMARALLPGCRLRLVSEQPDSLLTIPAWCQASGNKVVWQTEQRSLRGNGVSRVCMAEYVFDIERSKA